MWKRSTHLEVRRPVGISSHLLPRVFTESDSVVRLAHAGGEMCY